MLAWGLLTFWARAGLQCDVAKWAFEAVLRLYGGTGRIDREASSPRLRALDQICFL